MTSPSTSDDAEPAPRDVPADPGAIIDSAGAAGGPDGGASSAPDGGTIEPDPSGLTPSPATPAAPPRRVAPRPRWDVPKTALVALGFVIVSLAIAGDGPWWPLRHIDIPLRTLSFGIAAVVLFSCVQGASLAYLTGRWKAIAGWVAAALLLLGGALIVLNIAAPSLPDALTVPIPRLAVFIGGVLVLIIGALRDSNALSHTRDQLTDPDDWFIRTGRVLQAVHFWTPDQAREQMRRARAEFDHAHSRRTLGTPAPTPFEHFGSSEDYADSLTERPSITADPLRSGRWYYLSTSIALGAWAAFRTFTVGWNWLTVLLFFFGAVAAAMFVWASLKQHRAN